MSLFACFFRVAVLCFIIFFPAVAAAQDWTVAKTTKQVSYTVDKTTWQPVEVGALVPNKAWVSTGPRGRVTLTRGKESISLHPNTLGAVITTEGFFSRKTDVVHQKGEIALNIEKRGRPHTFVHTPFLAAAVKGTSFTVTVTDKAASVSVDEGLVQVSSFTGGQSANVGPGQQVTVDQAQSMSVAGIAEAPSVFSVEPTRASVAAVGQASPIGATTASSASGNGTGSTSGGSASSAGDSNSSTDSSSDGNGGYGLNGDFGYGGNNDRPGKGPSDDKPGKGPGDDKPGKGPGDDKPGKGPGDDKPGKGPGDDKPGKGPGDDKPGKGPGDDKPGKGPGDDKPGKGPGDDKPGKGPGDDKPGKGPGDDKPGKGPSEDKPGEGKPGEDRPGKGPGGNGIGNNGNGNGNGGKNS